MIYRVSANLAFTSEDEAKDFYHDCHLALAKSVTINPDQLDEEKGTIRLEECRHDEDPVLPCTTLTSETT